MIRVILFALLMGEGLVIGMLVVGTSPKRGWKELFQLLLWIGAVLIIGGFASFHLRR